MYSSKNHLLVPLFIAVLFFFCFATSFADVTYKQKSTSSGLMGAMDIEMESTIMLKADGQRQESVMKFTGPMAQSMPKGGEEQHITITRLDKELIWDINVLEKTYTQMSFDEMRMMLEQGMAEGEKAPEESTGVKFKIDVKKSGQKKKIGGYDCEEYVITMVGQGKDIMTGKAQEFEVQTHLWVTPEVKGYDQIKSYQKRMAQAMGWEGNFDPNMTQALAQYGMGGKELIKKMAEIKGFPMLTVTKMKGSEEEMTESEKEEKAKQEEVMQKAMGILGKKVEKSVEPEEKGVIFTMSTEVTDIQVKEVAGSQFELPEGLKKEEIPLEDR